MVRHLNGGKKIKYTFNEMKYLYYVNININIMSSMPAGMIVLIIFLVIGFLSFIGYGMYQNSQSGKMNIRSGLGGKRIKIKYLK